MKLGESRRPEDLIARGEEGIVEVRAMILESGEMPAMDWFRSLNKKGIGQLHAAVTIIETNLRSGRAPAGRTSLVPRSRNRLIEIRVTPPGATPPHLRLFATRRGMTFYAACGMTKKSNELKQNEIDEADRITDKWLWLQKEVK